MEAHIQSFAEYLHNRKNTSYNTEISYQRDLKKLNEYLKNRGISGPEAVREADLQVYLKELKNENYASATVSRNTATIRAFFQYLLKQGILKEDPSENLKPPKVEKKMPRVLSIQEVDRILEDPEELCFRRGDHGRHNTSYSEAFFRGTYDPERRRREKRSGDDGTFGYFIHPDVSGRKSCKNAGCIYEIPPEILDDEREYSRNGNSADTPSFVISTFRRWYTEASQILPSPGRRL